MGVINLLWLIGFFSGLATSDLETQSNSNLTESNGLDPKVKIHIHEHHGKVLTSVPQGSREEGMYFVKMIFEIFGEQNELSTDNLKQLFVDIGIDSGDVSNPTAHIHSERAMDSDSREHNGDHTEAHQRHVRSQDGNGRRTPQSERKSNVRDTGHKHWSREKCQQNGGIHNRSHDSKSSRPIGRNGHSRKHERQTRSKHTPHHHINHIDCLNVHELLNVYHLPTYNHLTAQQFLHLSPAIIYQLNNPNCKRTGHTDHVHNEANTSSSATVGFSGISAAVWGYSTLAVIIISLVGLLGVAVIPIMQKVFYNHLLQFLVALAVGALTGDALLHLLPHAIVGESLHHDGHGHSESHGNHETHQSAVLKGLFGLAGLFFFFLMERLVAALPYLRKKRKEKKRKTCRKETLACNADQYIVQPCETEGIGEGGRPQDRKVRDTCRAKDTKHSHSDLKVAEEECMLSISHSPSSQLHSHGAIGEILTSSVTSVAWMVILGDGIHNFSDGLAIGAAFTNSISGGFSTAVAVFCHELPHEIGDFAVLLRTGMSVKQAVIYNILSSFLCLIGMMIGIVIGNFDEVSQWIFAAVAGMFIYIAMVDMLPEMTSNEAKETGHPFFYLLLHLAGLLSGAGILFVIALYEEHFLTILEI